MDGKYRFLIPWFLGAVFWVFVSLTVLLEYQKTQPPGQGHLRELWFLLSLLWLEFGFAGIYQAVRKKRGYKILALVLTTILPPLLLHFFIFMVLSPW